MMGKIQILRFLLGISFALTMATPGMAQSSESRWSDECERDALTSKASRLIDIELVSRAARWFGWLLERLPRMFGYLAFEASGQFPHSHHLVTSA